MGRDKKFMGDAIKSVNSSGKTSYIKRADLEKMAERADRDEEESRKRKREKKDEEKRKWEKELKGRKYICDRQVDRTKMGTHPVIDIINQRGLQFFFDPIKGFKPKLVLDFYANMEVDEKEEKITSRLGKKTVLITPTVIAKSVCPWQAFREVPGDQQGGTLQSMSPRSEKLPRREDGEVIFVFGSSEEVVDWALLIWRWMVRFRKRLAPSKPDIPFPAMVTALCEAQGILVTEKLLPSSPGPITGGSLEKSKLLSQPPLPNSLGFPMPTARTQPGRIEEYTRIMATQP
ncbi:hypothetical protein RHSIM_Rhsim02G0143500 [Rhododendron simsii]|uniref:Uncharacterized protein n=1 Tax=Rhododendron simsii TaxID=118357 RepID=A0A834H9R4_RHOSS|nr:hypothetical protein RHSIM_Rhsim02G0143500 [Rhododendron simsii]